ncbi:MAG: hypothetical protein MUE41_05815 [Gemmatimonadaceae bacterium]|jgi:hypothetical protein|nr:hypothetical protein [Gemmatimonadaceae bacterium]
MSAVPALLRAGAAMALVTGAACARPDATPLDDALTIAATWSGDRATLVLATRDGARLNALSPPALELADGRVIRWSGARSAADSDYFTGNVRAEVRAPTRPLRGVLRAVTCPRDARVCRAHEVRVTLR